jgi:HicB family
MKMSLAVEALLADVMAVGALGDELVSDVAQRIAAVLERSVPSRILDLLSDVAAELSGELPDGRVEVRLAGDDVELAYADETLRPPETDAELSARITLRLSDQLKSRVEERASRAGVSVNSWVLRTLERSASSSNQRNSRAGSRLRGYGTS